jgi:hypothetical protein
MASRSPVDVLRQRADALRRVAVRLDGGELRRIVALAGDETWRGPTATAFGDDLRTAADHLDRAHGELLRGAARLDAAADDLERAERAALLAPASGPR